MVDKDQFEQLVQIMIDQVEEQRKTNEALLGLKNQNEAVSKQAADTSTTQKTQATAVAGESEKAPAAAGWKGKAAKVGGAVANLGSKAWEYVDSNFDPNRKYRETYESSSQQAKAFVQDMAAWGYMPSKGEIADIYQQFESVNKRRYEAGMEVENVLHRNDFLEANIKKFLGIDLGRLKKKAAHWVHNWWDSDLGRDQMEEDFDNYREQDPYQQAMMRNKRILKQSQQINQNNRYHDEY